MTTNVPNVPEYTGDVPLIGQGETEFSQNAQDSLQYQAELPTNLNSSISAMNTLGGEVEDLAESAELSNSQAAAVANFKGDWSGLTGALSTPASVKHNGLIWLLLNDLADVTASEPSVTANWEMLGNTASLKFDTIADLEAANLPVGAFAHVKWVNEAGKVGGGLFEIVTYAEAISRGITTGYTITNNIFSGEGFLIANGNVAVVNDNLFGFQNALLAEAGIVPDGVPDKASDSQCLDALLKIFGGKVGAFPTVSAMLTGTSANGVEVVFAVGDLVQTVGRSNIFDGGGAFYSVQPVGTVSDGVDGHHLNYSYFEAQGFQLIYVPTGSKATAASFGVVANGVADDTVALNNLFDYCRNGSPLDGLPKGRVRPVFSPRGRIRKSGTLNLIDFLVEVDFANSEIIQLEASDVINLEGNQANIKNAIIRFDDAVLSEDIISNEVYGIRLSGGQPVAITSESVFSEISQVWCFGAWRGVGISSTGIEGGLFWQFIFKQLYMVDCFDYSYYLETVSQVGTTTTIQNCHAGAKLASKVSKGSNVYIARQHHTSAADTEPEVGANWEDYWILDNLNSVNEGEWAVGNFYRTHAKGYLINNVQTVNFKNCSMDGGNNLQSGNVIDSLNSFIAIDSFHLEGHNLLRADIAPLEIGSDANIGWIYLYDLRVRLPASEDKAPLVGGKDGRLRNIAFNGVRNHTQNPSPTGTMYNFDGGDPQDWFTSVDLGAGIPEYLNLPANSRSVRGTPKQSFGLGIVPAGTNPTVVLESEDNGALFDANASGGVDHRLG